MHLTLKHLRYFTALVDAGTFSRAAEVLHITQPALSQQIKELEAQFGTQLVERQPRRVLLTPAGHEFLRHAARVLAEMQALEASARWRQGLSGRLAIGVIPTVAPYLLPVVLPALRSQNVTLDLGVQESQTDRLLQALAVGKLDAAIMALPSGNDQLVEVPLFDDRFLLAGSSAQIDRLGQGGVTPDALDPGRLLLLEEGHCLAEQALEVCALKPAQTRVDLGASSLATLCGLAAEGFGMTFLPEIAVKTESAAAPGTVRPAVLGARAATDHRPCAAAPVPR